MIDNLKELAIQLQKEQDLCAWLKYFAAQTWYKIGFARARKGLRIHETTLTQDLVFNFLLFAGLNNIPIQLFEASDERSNGNDVEILIEAFGGYVMLPCQAKIIYKNNRYQALNHTVSGKQQVDYLLEYASHKKGIPIYLLYNFCSNQKVIDKIQSAISFNIELFGCSIIHAEQLKINFFDYIIDKWQIPSFEAIHPWFTYPFYSLACSNNEILEKLIKASTVYSGDIRLYSYEELINDDYWINLAPPPQLGKLPNAESQNKVLIGDRNFQKGFNPKFRIIISQKPIGKNTELWLLT